MGLMANQTKYGCMNAVNFTIDQLHHGLQIMIKKCVPHIMKESLLLLKDLLKPLKNKNLQIFDFNIKKCVYL